MQRSSKDTRSKIIATIIIGIMTFLFIHSELELFSYEENNHHTHDYCELVKDALTQISGAFSDELFINKINNLLFLNCFEDLALKLTEIKISGLLDYHLPQRSNEIVLYNQEFLI